MLKWMRTSLTLLLCFLMVSAAFPVMTEAAAGSESEITIGASSASVSKGDTVKFKVTVQNVNDMYGLQFRVKYDASKLSFKQAAALNGYNDFGGQKSDVSAGTVLMPLLREQISNKAPAASLEVAEITFTAQAAGKAVVELTEVKAVSTESYVNEAGKKDLKTVVLANRGPFSLTIQGGSNPGGPSIPGNPGTPGGENGTGSGNLDKTLREVEQLLKNLQLDKAASVIRELLGKDIPPLTQELRAQWTAVIQKLIHEISSRVTVRAGSDGFFAMDEESLRSALSSIKDVSALAGKLGLPSGTGSMLNLSFAGAQSGFKVTEEQLAELGKHSVGMQLEWLRGKVKVIPNALPKGADVTIKLSAHAQEGQVPGKGLKPAVSYHLEMKSTSGGKETPVSVFTEAVELVLPFSTSKEKLHKLGVYKWNEVSKSWEYIRNAKLDNDEFKLNTRETGSFAVMEYAVDYADVQKVYKEARHAIEALTARHLMNGTGQGMFSPEQHVTRAEFTSLLVRALDLDVSDSKSQIFKDVKPGAWFAREVNAAWEAGLIQGNGQAFHPNEKLTREQMAVMLMNAAEKAGKSAGTGNSVKFRDDDRISAWAKDAIYAAKALGLIQGDASHNYAPKGHASRSEAAIILLRWLNQ